MEGVGGVACPRNGISSEPVRQKKEFSDDYNDGRLGPRLLLMLKEGSRSSSAELLSTLRQLRDSLVGDEKAKASALELGVVEDLLSLLDAAAAGAGAGDTYEQVLFQAVGVFCILSSSAEPKNGAEACLAPRSTSPRIAQHIARALEYPSERLTAAALRAIISLFCSSPLAGNGGAGGGGRHCDCTAETLSAAAAAAAAAVPLLLREVSARILDEVMSTAGDSWTEAAKILGVQALAALARDGDLARSLVPGVCSKGAALLGPILPAREHRGPSRAAASRTEAMRAVTTPVVLELLLNLSCANPTAITAWLTSCAPDWSTWAALKGLEVELNNRNEKVRIMAGLILVTCFISSETGEDPPPETHASGVSWKPALDEVVAHRVLPLFFRTLRSWASSHETATAASSANGSPTASSSATSSAGRFAAACGGGGYAAAVCSSVTAMMELASLRWQREAVAYGAVDALTEFLRRARSATPAAASSGDGVGAQQAKHSTSTSRSSREDTPCVAAAAGVVAATAAALRALATLCSRCEPARERIVAVGFHSAIANWLVGGSGGGGSGGGGGGDGGVGAGGGGGESDDGGPVQQAALLLVRNLGRSSVPCSALVGFKVHERILGVLSRLEEAGERRARGEGGKVGAAAAAAVAEATVTLASSGLANMALGHEVVKQAIAGSECLHGVCKAAVDASSEKSVRMASIAVLKGTCYAASLPVRVKVAYCLGGVNGMLGLIQGPRDGAVLQGLQTLRYLLREVPLWALCRFEWQVSEADRAAATAASPSSTGSTASATAATAAAAAAGAGAGAGAAAAPTTATAAAPTAVPSAAASAAAGEQGGSPGISSEQPAASGDAYFIPAGAGDARLGRSEYRAERGGAGNARLVRHFWGEITPSVGSDGRHGGVGGGGGGGGIDASRPEPMEVEFQQGGRFDSGATAAATAAAERSVERHVASKLPRKGAVALGLERLIEAVLGKLEGAGTGHNCDDTSCAALRLLHVLSAADDSQRAALRTPRVLRLTLPYLMCDAMGPYQQQQQQYPLGSQQPIVHEPAGWAARAGTPCVGAPDCPRHHHSSSRKTTPPYRSADLAARLLLEQLVPQRPGDNSITSPYSAFSATGGVTAGMVTSVGAARARAAAGGRGFRTSSVGSWCAGLEFDHAGGGGVRRTGGE